MNYPQGSGQTRIVHVQPQYTPFCTIREQKVSREESSGCLKSALGRKCCVPFRRLGINSMENIICPVASNSITRTSLLSRKKARGSRSIGLLRQKDRFLLTSCSWFNTLQLKLKPCVASFKPIGAIYSQKINLNAAPEEGMDFYFIVRRSER
jgi:hypothetical protein